MFALSERGERLVARLESCHCCSGGLVALSARSGKQARGGTGREAGEQEGESQAYHPATKRDACLLHAPQGRETGKERGSLG